MKTRNRLFFLLASLFVLSSCANESKLSFRHQLRVDDTLSEYSFHLYARILSDYNGKNLPLVITVFSPEGKKFRDTINFPLIVNTVNRETEVAHSGIWRDIKWLYRDNITFPSKGQWVISIEQLSSKKELSNIGDFGIIVNEK